MNVEICKKHNLILKNRKDKNGKFCSKCIYIPCGKGKNPPNDPMNLKQKNKRKPGKKGKRGRK